MSLQRPPTLPGYICLGKIVGPHGVRGEVKVKSFTENPQDIGKYGVLVDQHQNAFSIQNTKEGTKGFIIIKFSEVTSREKAEEVKGKFIYIQRQELPPANEDEILYEDLIGSTVQFEESPEIGKIVDVFSNGAQDILEIKIADKKVLIPFLDTYIQHYDSKEKILTLKPTVQEFIDI